MPVLVMLSMALCSCSTPPATGAAATEQVAVPAWMAGDTWAYRIRDSVTGAEHTDHYAVTAIAQDGTVSLTDSDSQGTDTTVRRNRDLNLVQDGQSHFAPYVPQLSFPLYVGKSWTVRYQAYKGDSPRAWDHDYSAKVTAYEFVDTPAGRFEAFRIEAYDVAKPHTLQSQAGRGMTWQHRITIWYAPQIKGYVKIERS